jgi:hypothetical protein
MSSQRELEASGLDLWQKCDKLLYPKSNFFSPAALPSGVFFFALATRLVAAKLLDDQEPAACAGPSLPCCRRAPRNMRRAEQGRELGALQALLGSG